MNDPSLVRIQPKRKDTPMKCTTPKLEELGREGDIFKLHIEEADEDVSESLSEDEHTDEVKSHPEITANEVAHTIILKRKKTEEPIKIEVVETDFTRPRKPSIMKPVNQSSLDIPKPSLEKRNSVTFDEMPADIPIPASLHSEEEESEEEEEDRNVVPELESDIDLSEPVEASKLALSIGTLQLKKGKKNAGEFPDQTRTPNSTPFGTPAVSHLLPRDFSANN